MARGADEGARVLIVHIASRDAWAAAQASGDYTADSLSTEGFIHCSDPHQYLWVANQRFRGRTDLVLLHIDPARVGCEVKYENLEGGQQLFPHIYGAIPIAAIVNVTALRPLADGSFHAFGGRLERMVGLQPECDRS